MHIHKNRGIKTTNLDTYISSEITVHSGEDGSTCIPVMKLNEILSALPDCELNFSISSNGKITINNNIGNYTIMAHNPEEFPSEPILDSVNSVSFNSTQLKHIINLLINRRMIKSLNNSFIKM